MVAISHLFSQKEKECNLNYKVNMKTDKNYKIHTKFNTNCYKFIYIKLKL